MERIIYNISLITDVILSSGSASEGTKESLHYIPGSKFLGIVASKLYDGNSEKTLDLFHNGTVRFGDAHIMGSKQRSLPLPAGWVHIKGGSIEDTLYLSGKLMPKTVNMPEKKEMQLKEVKEPWYFTTFGKAIRPVTGFSLKSAYDPATKTSKEAQLFGYHYLARGSQWQFTVDFDDERLVDIVDNVLQGKHRIGRSRSAEFGLVEIIRSGSAELENRTIEKGEIIIYAESNLCFYDASGMSTPRPTPEQLKLPGNSKILWERSAIRTRIYEAWNRKRYNRDADRFIIEKGSVIIAQSGEDFNAAVFSRGVGSHTSEGFGRVIINPSFFEHDDSGKLMLQLKIHGDNSAVDYTPVESSQFDKPLLTFLENAADNESGQLSIDEKVNGFIRKHGSVFRQISPSQWGQIRNYAKYSDSKESLFGLLFDDNTGYLLHGRSENLWRTGNKTNILKEAIEANRDQCVEFTVKLASEMAKQKQEKNENESKQGH
ncbi:MAG: hypothetical protein P1P82_16985 [Bacteroidales bacterium]|nr:hypothetical protein [Bacteroidales bacterium]